MLAELPDRCTRVFSLDSEVYGEVAVDPEAMGQALLVVIAVAVLEGFGRLAPLGVTGLFAGVVDGCLRWGIWSVSIHATARALGTPSKLGALTPALGFAAAPFALGALEILPWIGTLAWAAKWVLGITAFVLATSRILAVEKSRALLISAIGLFVAVVISIPVSWLYPVS